MRILLLSLYYPPLNTIAAQRVKAFQKYLTEYGHIVDVITRYYDTEQQKGQSMLLGKNSPNNFEENYIKNKNIVYTNFDSQNEKLSFSEKLPGIIKGLYNYLHVDVFHYGWIKYVFDVYKIEFKNNKYDYIIASYGPPIVMKIAKELSKKYNIPYVIDFRDSYIDERDKFVHLWVKRKLQHNLLKNAKGLIFSTDGMKDFFNKKVATHIKTIPTCVVYNGVDSEILEKSILFDENIVKQFNQIKDTHSLLLLHTGTIYKEQNFSFFINAVDKYNEQKKKNIAILFLGLTENKTNELPSKSFIYKLPKTDHSTTLLLQKKADALLLPIWDGRYTGFSGKTQEYLYSENFIITSPHPQDDLKLFLNISPNVYISEDYQHFLKIMDKLLKGEQKKLPIKNKEILSRKYWIEKMNAFLIKL